ncbi:MAG: RHS repeat-associated core domain-containing protein [Actinomycetota bacterium]
MSSSAANLGTNSYDPFGQVLSVSGTQSALGYRSDLTDPVTKQVDMGTRWYAPSTGRFSTQDVVFGDPLHPISLNQWAYGGANPITMWDPTGMRFTSVDKGISGCKSAARCERLTQDVDIAAPTVWTGGGYTTIYQPEPPEQPVPTPVSTATGEFTGGMACGSREASCDTGDPRCDGFNPFGPSIDCLRFVPGGLVHDSKAAAFNAQDFVFGYDGPQADCAGGLLCEGTHLGWQVLQAIHSAGEWVASLPGEDEPYCQPGFGGALDYAVPPIQEPGC